MAVQLRRITDTPNPHEFQAWLMNYNATRLAPGFAEVDIRGQIHKETEAKLAEASFVERERRDARTAIGKVPREASAFVQWFESLREYGPGQDDPLFPWLAREANMEQMSWFLTQEAAGEAGFEDLVAMAQVKVSETAKLEMARNYWDEMGRGHARGMHGPMLGQVVTELQLNPTVENSVWESLALANLMVALAVNRRYAYQAIGALGVIELTAPGRAALVNEGLVRLEAPKSARMYFQLHAGLDIEHSKAWNEEVIYSLVKENPETAQPLAEGAWMRLTCGKRCFDRYRQHLLLGDPD